MKRKGKRGMAIGLAAALLCLCLPVFARLWTDLPHAAFGWLLAGGIIYTIGGVIYALKLPVFNACLLYTSDAADE